MDVVAASRTPHRMAFPSRISGSAKSTRNTSSSDHELVWCGNSASEQRWNVGEGEGDREDPDV